MQLQRQPLFHVGRPRSLLSIFFHVITACVYVKQLSQSFPTLTESGIEQNAPIMGDFASRQLMASESSSSDTTPRDKLQPTSNETETGQQSYDSTMSASAAPLEAPIVVFAGLVRKTSEIWQNTWDLLTELACEHNVSVHIGAAEDPDGKYSQYYNNYHTNVNASCNMIRVEVQNKIAALPRNRVERLALIRDAQRKRIQQLFFPSGNEYALRQSVVILSDLDLFELPTADKMMKRVKLMQGAAANSSATTAEVVPSPSVLCAMGLVARPDRFGPGCRVPKEEVDPATQKTRRTYEVKRSQQCLQRMYTTKYYDTFATVFWPDSFAHPLHKRLTGRHYPGENTRVADLHQLKMTPYLQKQAREHPNRLAPMRSCFGGLVLYRASVWLTPQCQYSIYQERFMKHQPTFRLGNVDLHNYASVEDGVPCEHVSFHDCLHRKIFNTSTTLVGKTSDGYQHPQVALDPHMVTYWLKSLKT